MLECDAALLLRVGLDDTVRSVRAAAAAALDALCRAAKACGGGGDLDDDDDEGEDWGGGGEWQLRGAEGVTWQTREQAAHCAAFARERAARAADGGAAALLAADAGATPEDVELARTDPVQAGHEW